MLDALERQQKLPANQWKIVSAAILGDMLDFFDFFLIGYVLTFVVNEWHLSFMESGVILLAAGLGAIPGAFFWGWMADRIGRRKVFIATALNFSLATGAMAFTPDQYGWIVLAFFRFLVGIGVAVLFAIPFTPFGDTVVERLSTLSEGIQDGSFKERLEEFVTLWNLPDSSLFGSGFTITDVGAAGAMPIDGMIIACLNFRSHLAIDAIEQRIGKPVVTSTQAVLWHLLRLAGVTTPIAGYGRLLREH